MKNESNLLVLNHHLIKNARILTLEKLTAKEIYSILISPLKNKPTSQNYFENLFPNYTFDWQLINSYQRNLQYKILHSIIYVNRKMYVFRKIDSLCSICHLMMRLLHICFVNVYASSNYGFNLKYFS